MTKIQTASLNARAKTGRYFSVISPNAEIFYVVEYEVRNNRATLKVIFKSQMFKSEEEVCSFLDSL